MATEVQPPIDIGSLIARSPHVRGGRPHIAGTGVTVMRVAGWHKQGMTPQEIAGNFGYITVAQVHAALAYYFANQAEIDADIAGEEEAYDRLAQGRSHAGIILARQ